MSHQQPGTLGKPPDTWDSKGLGPKGLSRTCTAMAPTISYVFALCIFLNVLLHVFVYIS